MRKLFQVTDRKQRTLITEMGNHPAANTQHGQGFLGLKTGGNPSGRLQSHSAEGLIWEFKQLENVKTKVLRKSCERVKNINKILKTTKEVTAVEDR